MRNRIRMADIANRLNISVVSVSKALSGKPGVSDELREKILAIAHQMEYECSRIKRGEAANIGMLVADRFFNANTFYTNLYREIVLESGKEHLACVLEIITQEDEQAAKVPSLLSGQRVTAVLIIGNMDERYVLNVIESGLPYLLLDFNIPGRAMDSI